MNDLIRIPGISLTLGMTQGDQTPYARVSGRSGIFSASKRLSLSDHKGLIAGIGMALIANAVKKDATKKAKAEKRTAPTLASSESSQANPFQF